MFDPVLYATAMAVQAVAENQAADDQYAWRKRMEERGEKSALAAYALSQQQLSTRVQQERRSATEEKEIIRSKGRQLQAAAATRAKGLSLESASVQALQQQFGKDALKAIGVRETEQDYREAVASAQAHELQQTAQARLVQVQAGPRPSSFGKLANIFGSAMQGYGVGKSIYP